MWRAAVTLRSLGATDGGGANVKGAFHLLASHTRVGSGWRVVGWISDSGEAGGPSLVGGAKVENHKMRSIKG